MNEQLDTLCEELDYFINDIDTLRALIQIVLTEVFQDGNFPMKDPYFCYLQSFEHVLRAADNQAKQLSDKANSFWRTLFDLIHQQPQAAPENEATA